MPAQTVERSDQKQSFSTLIDFKPTIFTLLFYTVLNALQWTSIATACLVVFFAQLGLQYLPYLLMAELFPSGTNFSKHFIDNVQNLISI